MAGRSGMSCNVPCADLDDLVFCDFLPLQAMDIIRFLYNFLALIIVTK